MDDKKRVTLLVLNDYLKFERKIYQIFGVSLGRPIELKAILYFFAAVIVEIAFYFTPIIGSILHILPAVFLLLIPIGISYLLTGVRTEGRNPIAFFRSVFFYQVRKAQNVTYYRGREIAKPAVYKINGYATANYSSQEEIIEILEKPIDLPATKRKRKPKTKVLKNIKRSKVKERKTKEKQKKVVQKTPQVVMPISTNNEPIKEKNILQPIEFSMKNRVIKPVDQILEKAYEEIAVTEAVESILVDRDIKAHSDENKRSFKQFDSVKSETTQVITDIEENGVSQEVKKVVSDIEDISVVEPSIHSNEEIPTQPSSAEEIKEVVSDIENTADVEDIQKSGDIEDISVVEPSIQSNEEITTQSSLAEESSQVEIQEQPEEVEETLIDPIRVESQDTPTQKVKQEKKIIRLPSFRFWAKPKQKLPKTGTMIEETIAEAQQVENSDNQVTQQQIMREMILHQNRPSITELKEQLKEEKRQQKLEKKFEKVMKRGD
ncbi:TcpE family conjugal transfer membrane protein [Rummeliibacillus pycnus]|uniref:TcpE family conjugal transfer membrane protein n=1 Tax=Rummeliibacillus pycnus TaxID=101070 RepID=UPI003D2BF2AD